MTEYNTFLNYCVSPINNEKKLLDFTKLDEKYDDAGVSKTKGAKHEVTTYKPS